MRKKIYTILGLLFIFATSLSYYFINHTIHKLKDVEVKAIYDDRFNEYKTAIENKKVFLDAFSKFIVHSKPVIEGYLHNDRQKIINFLAPLYKNLYEKQLINELHFFKPPAMSYVNFSNLNKYNIDVSKARKDVVFIETSFAPSTHFYICRVYPGFRATYPIIYKNKLLGAVSFGIDINFLKSYFNSLGAKTSLYFNDAKLKDFLLPSRYEYYKNYPLHNGFRVDGEYDDIDLSKKYFIKNEIIYTIIPIEDLFKNKIAYLVIKDDLKKYLNIIKATAKKKIIIEIATYFIILFIVMILFNVIFRKLNKFNKIFELIKQKKFSKIPQKISNPKDEFDIYENNIIETADDIRNYLLLLENKLEQFQNKAYIDGLTKVFNRTFLEENKKQIILKAQIQNKDLSVIMFDIDDFKKINDTYGHDIGDLVLTTLVNEVKQIIKDDYLIRYGGEEFVIILYSNINSAFNIAERIRKTIESLEINISNNIKLKITISLGVSHILHPEECLDDIIKRADEKLYQAKNNGKNLTII